MQMLKYIIALFWLTLSVNCFSQAEDDGKGTRYRQLSGCQDTSGTAKLDSCFRMTDTLGKLTICLTIDDLIKIIDNDGGDSLDVMVDCDEVQDCIDDDFLCELMNLFGTSNYVSGDFAVIRKANGDCKVTNLFDIPGFGDTCRVVNNASGSYTHFNENQVSKEFGYRLVCKNDSTIVLTDWDGTRIDSCEIMGGMDSGSGFDCDSVEACLSDGLLCELLTAFPLGTYENGILIFGVDDLGNCETYNLNDLLCDALADLPEGDTEEGDQYVTIKNGQCVLTDTVYIDICGILQEIQEEGLLTQGDIGFILRGGECFKVPFQTENSNCIAMDISAGFFRADIIIDPDPDNVIECRANGLFAPSASAFNCDSLTANFPGGSYQSTDRFLTFDGATGDCEYTTITIPTIDCQTISDVFAPGSLTPTDSIYAGAGANCKKIPAESLSPCGQTLTHWTFGTCEEPRIIVQCGTSCVYMTPCDIQDYFCGALLAPGARRSTGSYPTLENTGIRTYKSKKQAQKSDIPIGGLYLIEGQDEIKVKTKQL